MVHLSQELLGNLHVEGICLKNKNHTKGNQNERDGGVGKRESAVTSFEHLDPAVPEIR